MILRAVLCLATLQMGACALPQQHTALDYSERDIPTADVEPVQAALPQDALSQDALSRADLAVAADTPSSPVAEPQASPSHTDRVADNDLADDSAGSCAVGFEHIMAEADKQITLQRHM